MLETDFDGQHQRTSDADGFASYVPAAGNVYLAIVHEVAADDSGEVYDKTHYSAAMVLPIPNHKLEQWCPQGQPLLSQLLEFHPGAQIVLHCGRTC